MKRWCGLLLSFLIMGITCCGCGEDLYQDQLGSLRGDIDTENRWNESGNEIDGVESCSVDLNINDYEFIDNTPNLKRIQSITYPICFECGNDLTQKSDPLNAYQGVGIVCDMCGFSKEKVMKEKDKQILDKIPLFYYTCMGCHSVDICYRCYERQYNQCTVCKIPMTHKH